MQENPGAQVLTAVLKDPGRPRITWYGADGERVELSGAVLANWVAKTANLLVDELDAGPGTRVRLDLPAHWRTIVWALATWYVGAAVSLDAGATDLLVTDDATSAAGAAEAGVPTVAVALPALARRFEVSLPGPVLDSAATVLAYPDVPPPSHLPDGDEPALVTARAVVSVAELVADAATSGRHLIVTDGSSAALLRTARAVLGVNGSIVLVESPGPDGPQLARLAATEQVDVHDDLGDQASAGR